jgi:CBS domain-containing protein
MTGNVRGREGTPTAKTTAAPQGRRRQCAQPDRPTTQTLAMALEVAEIMNHELFSVAPDDRVGDVLDQLLAYGVTAAPVLDESGRPLGFIALRDLVPSSRDARVLTRMVAPADVVPAHARVSDAARLMTERSRHHLACVDEQGRAVGFVGALDVLRGLTGAPVAHPDTFSHVDRASGLRWTDDALLTFDHAREAPAEPGIFKLIDAAPGRANRIVWAESTPDLRHRLNDLLAQPATAPPHLVDAALCGRLWFRWASTPRALAGVAPP